MSGQSGGYRLHLSTLNEQLTCKLCRGYFIDATTIIECLHSFCRSCIIKYLENNKYCPICEVQVHKSKPLLNIRPDHTLQDIVYKLVPGCYQNEMRCRREFYSKHPDAKSQASSPESRGEPIESHIYSLDESLSLSLEYYIPSTKDQGEGDKESTAKTLPRRYLRCPAAVTISHLQKLIRAKYGLSEAHRVDIMYKEEPLCGNYTLMDVMYIYHWRRKVPLHLSYRIFESSPKRLKLSEDNHMYEKILSNTRVDSIEVKREQSEKREWKEVQLKISETGVMSVTNISSFEKKSASNGDGNSEELITIDKNVGKIEKMPEGEKEENNEAPILESLIKKEDLDKSNVETLLSTTIPNTEVTESSQNFLFTQETRTVFAKSEYNKNIDGSESQKLNPLPMLVENPSKVVTRFDTEGESLVAQTQKANNQSKVKNSSIQDSSQLKNRQECTTSSTKKAESRVMNTNNNLISADTKGNQSQKENSKNSGKEIRSASTSVEIKQNVPNSMLSFQPKVGQVNNTYSKKIPKEKKGTLINSRKLDSKIVPEQSKSDVKPLAYFPITKSQATATVSLTKLATTVVSSPHSTTMSTQAVNTPVSIPQGGCLFVSAPQMTTCVVSTTTTISSIRSPSAANKSIPPSPQRLDCQPAKLVNSKPDSTATLKSDSTVQKVLLVKNNNNNLPTTSQSLASIGLNISTTLPGSVEMSPNVSHAVQNLVSTSHAKSNESKGENSLKIGSPSGRQGPAPSDIQMVTQSLNAHSGSSPISNSPRLSSSQTSTGTKRTSSQSAIEITSIYTVPPCPDAIPISLMPTKPSVRKHEIIAKGTNLNEICAKIGESSKEKIKAATRSKPEIPNLLKITKKTSVDSNKCIPNVPSIPIYTSGQNIIPSEDKPNASIGKETPKTGSVVSTSQSVPTSVSLQKGCSIKKQSLPVGYKTLRDPPKSWNPTLSKNNYVAARNQAKEMQTQSQGLTASDGNHAKPITSKPAKIFKMRNMPRYLGNPSSGVKRMYGVSNESKDKDQTVQNPAKNSSLSMMTIDPKTLSPIVSSANSTIVTPPPYSPTARSYQNTQFSRDMCRNPGSPISPRNSPINMLSTNPFIPSPTLNTNPKLIYTHFPPPYPDTSRFPNPLIRSPIGIPSHSAFHSSLPASINKYQRCNYLPAAAGYTTAPPPPTIQKILPSMHSSPKSPKSTSITNSSIFPMGKSEVQLSTRVENIALHLAKNAAQQELNIFNLSKTGNPTTNNFPNLLTTTTVTLVTSSGFTLTDTLPNVTTQATVKSKSQLEIKVSETESPKQKSKEPETVVLESAVEPPLTPKVKSCEGDAEAKEEKDIEKKKKTLTKINGDVATQNTSPAEKAEKEQKPSKNTEASSVSAEIKQLNLKEVEKPEKQVEINSEKMSNEAKSEDMVRKTGEPIQGKKSDVQRNKPES
ncbi:polycomb group protein Psc-like [Neodiprion fabricii]|uniref:polycomb group protein Psc-like n=1 Tax=Neodiprion fabricii TaxID=2872261 RepID=UPI001ED94B72|nr:polycomb group protein Psc-like [Neodiprion fabricii]XP_046421657.1 polycomb group protein Psc-like [Neodiprion fabricii]